ncbi:hypothetical protein ACSVC9_03650 [Clostridium sp. LBM24168]
MLIPIFVELVSFILPYDADAVFDVVSNRKDIKAYEVKNKFI